MARRGPRFLTVETRGKTTLRESRAAYFKSTPGVTAELVWVRPTASRVATLERAAWTGKAGPISRASLSVYELTGALISRIYHFPAEK